MPRQLAECSNGIWIIHQHQPSHDCIKLLIKLHFRRIAFDEVHICYRLRIRPRIGPVDSFPLAIYTHDPTAGPYEISSQKRNIPTTTTNIENAHTSAYPSLFKYLTCKRSKGLALTTKTVEFLVGMT